MNPYNLMKRCVQLCDKANPKVIGRRVGALVYNKNRIVGEGYREYLHYTLHVSKVSDYDPRKHLIVLHAERLAIWNAGENAKGGILYTSLEPCFNNFNPDPETGLASCCELIVESGIKGVVFGVLDFNPEVRGKGWDYLRENSLSVAYYPVFEEEIKRVSSYKICYPINHKKSKQAGSLVYKTTQR